MRSLGDVCLISLAILFVLLQIGSCYQCYSCVGINAALPRDKIPPFPPQVPFTNSCIDASDLSKLGKIECSGPKKACVKSVTTLLGEAKIYARSCADPADCKLLPEGSLCHDCSEDLCNSSTNVVPSLISVGVISLVFAKYFL